MANYTMTYNDYKAQYGSLAALDSFPTIIINSTGYNFKELFEARFAFREIGAETPEYWRSIAERYLREALLLFGHKIVEFERNLPNVCSREEVSEASSFDNFFLNPTIAANAASKDKLKVQSSSERTYNHHIVYNTDSVVDMIEAINSMQNILFECLLRCEPLFMSIY